MRYEKRESTPVSCPDLYTAEEAHAQTNIHKHTHNAHTYEQNQL